MRSAWREVSRHPGRFLALVLAIALSGAFVAGSIVYTATEARSAGRQLSAAASAADVVVETGADPSGAVLGRLAATPGVAHVEPTYRGYARFSTATVSGTLGLDSLPADERLRWARLESGRWPATDGEIALLASTAANYGLAEGGTLRLADYGREQTVELRVVGLVAGGRSALLQGEESGFVRPGYFTAAEQTPTFLLLAAPGTSPAALAEAVRGRVPADSTVRTADEQAEAVLAEVSDGVQVLRVMLLGFGGVALLAGSIIVANTFAILVAQRRRQIGLLRAVGADRGHVRRGLRAEALLVGATGALLGTALGVATGAAAAAVTGALADGLAVPWAPLGATAAVIVAVTLVAALVPTRRASRVAPLEALRPVPDAGAARRIGRTRAVVAAVLVALGAGVVGLGFALPDGSQNGAVPVLLLVAMTGCALVAVGVLAAAPLYVTALVRLAGRLGRRASPTFRLAAASAVRNPGRAAASATALMLAVGLIVTLQVGAASVRTSLLAEIGRTFPVDVRVQHLGGTLPAAVVDRLRAVPGVAAVTGVPSVEAEVEGGPWGGSTWPVSGLRADAAAVVRGGFDQLRPGVALVSAEALSADGLQAGDILTLSHGGRAETFTVAPAELAGGGIVVDGRTLDRLAPGAPLTQAWLAADPAVDPQTVLADIRRSLGGDPQLEVSGTLEEAARVSGLLDTMVLVATALLGVAVVIALIGIGNALGLSVLERTRESALLRALGLQRRQLRAVLAYEALLLAGVAALVGVAAGLVFGWIGTAAVVEDLAPLRLSVSPGQTLAVVAITVAAGVLASVLPARRAALASPVGALAAE